jgi:hypothetical protein
MKGEESKTIFSINGADSFRRRAAYALAAATALGLYLSLSFSLSSRISDSHSVLLRDHHFYSFLERIFVFVCWPPKVQSSMQTWWVESSGARKRSEMRCTLHQAVFK